MTRYVKEAREKGATPVLVTPLTRRQFKNGTLSNDLALWAVAIKEVAVQTRTPVLDLLIGRRAGASAVSDFVGRSEYRVSADGIMLIRDTTAAAG